jgi:hypothetical protein
VFCSVPSSVGNMKTLSNRLYKIAFKEVYSEVFVHDFDFEQETVVPGGLPIQFREPNLTALNAILHPRPAAELRAYLRDNTGKDNQIFQVNSQTYLL